jgi:hypothetical protein
MCPQPAEDYTYAAYGGLIQRADMMYGRVGSAFAPAEGVPGPIHEHDGAYPTPALTSPEEGVPQPPAAPPDQSQAETSAFDPGDILSSGPR